MTDIGKRTLNIIKDCPNVYNTNKYKGAATSLCLYRALWHWELLGTTTVANEMSDDLLVITEKHKLKTNWTPVIQCKHISGEPHRVIHPAQHPVLKTQESTTTWKHAYILSQKNLQQNKSHASCILSEDNKKEFLSVKTAYTHRETKIIQEYARMFIGELRREKLNPQVTWPPSFLEGYLLFSGTMQFWKSDTISFWAHVQISLLSVQKSCDSVMYQA